MPDAAGGEGGHGAAKPDTVVHRHAVNQSLLGRPLDKVWLSNILIGMFNAVNFGVYVSAQSCT